MIAFSREKIEDERISQMRLEALQWGVIGNAIMLIVSTLVVYDGAYLFVLIFNIFTPLVLFICRFYWLMRFQALKNEE